MTSLAPNGIAGWAGLAAIGGVILYHKKLGSMGLILGLALGAYLYFVADNTTTTA